MFGDGGAGEGGEFEEVLVCPLVEENKQNHLQYLKNVHNDKNDKIRSSFCFPKMEAEKCQVKVSSFIYWGGKLLPLTLKLPPPNSSTTP